MSVVHNLRKWQFSAVSKLKTAKYGMLKAVTGSGKSVVIAKLAHFFWSDNNRRKIIVSVPSTAIGNNFRNVIFPNENIHFTPSDENFLIGTGSDTAKIQSLREFLSKNSKNFQDNILICTHMTLQRGAELFPELFKNCLVVPDEFHHSRVGSNEESYNKIGKCIKSISDDPSNHLLMVTATPFRSDNAEVFPASIRPNIVSFCYNLSEYLQDCEYLQEVRYESHFYNHVSTYFFALSEYLKVNGIQNSIVFLPNVRLQERRAHVCTVLAAALQINCRDDGGQLWLEDQLKNPDCGPYRRINSGELFWEYRHQESGKILRIIDLDDDNSVREERLKWLHENRQADPNIEYMLISLQVFIEGGDFPAINRVINLSIDNSYLRMIQKWGRATRDYKGKKVATLVQFMNINDGYNLSNSDSYNESQLDEMIDLQEMDLDQLELQRLAEIRGRLYETVRPTVAVDSDTDTGEIIPPDDNSSSQKFSLLGFFANNWQQILAVCLLGSALGLLVEYGTKEYAKKDGHNTEVRYQKIER